MSVRLLPRLSRLGRGLGSLQATEASWSFVALDSVVLHNLEPREGKVRPRPVVHLYVEEVDALKK
jgi:hypothetical protein